MNELNEFYARFDRCTFHDQINELCNPLETIPNNVLFSNDSVERLFAKINPYKARGPDGVSGKILKECCKELSSVFTRMFQLLMNSHFVPKSWRTSVIVPIAKTRNAKEKNDFRPVALTSTICKCMERLVCNQLTTSLSNRLDPLQFAYKAKRGVEDATLHLMNFNV